MKKLFIGLILALCCAGCGGHKKCKVGRLHGARFRIEHLDRSSASIVTYAHGIEVRAKAWTPRQVRKLFCGHYFRRGHELDCILLTVANNTAHYATVDLRTVTPRICDNNVVTHALFGAATNTTPGSIHKRLAVGTVAAIPVFLGIDAILLGFMGAWSFILPVNMAGLCVAAVLICDDHVTEEWESRERLRVTARLHLAVRPGGQESTLIFLKKDRAEKSIRVPVHIDGEGKFYATVPVPLAGEAL